MGIGVWVCLVWHIFIFTCYVIHTDQDQGCVCVCVGVGVCVWRLKVKKPEAALYWCQNFSLFSYSFTFMTLPLSLFMTYLLSLLSSITPSTRTRTHTPQLPVTTENMWNYWNKTNGPKDCILHWVKPLRRILRSVCLFVRLDTITLTFNSFNLKQVIGRTCLGGSVQC